MERNDWNERIDTERRFTISRVCTLSIYTVDLTNLNIGAKLEKDSGYGKWIMVKEVLVKPTRQNTSMTSNKTQTKPS